MKKIFLFFALLAGIAVMTGCQKDQDVVTLKAVIDHDTKAYFGGADANNNLVTPYWDGNDRVYVKGYNSDFTRASCSLELPSENSTTFATISNMPVSNVYCAVFPASAVKEMGTPDAGTNGTTAKITFKHDQLYSEENNHQRLEMPMGAVTTDNVLIFKNLCGILRIKVVNTTGHAFNVKRVSVMSEDGTFIAGDGNVTLYKNGDPRISMSPYHSYNVDQAIQLHASEYTSMGAIPSSSDGSSYKTFDIIVPPFSADALTFDVESIETGTGFGYFTQTVNSTITVDRNEIVNVTLTVGNFQRNNHVYLTDGPSFNDSIRKLDGWQNIQAIWFGNPAVGLPTDRDDYVRLEASYSPNPVYGYITVEQNVPVLHVNADIDAGEDVPIEFYAHANCSTMFAGFSNVSSILFNIHKFYTEDVTDMSYMFAGCSSLNNVPDIPTFVTTNVETMAYMFDGTHLTALDLQAYSTQHLRPDGMKGMFRNCAYLQTLDISSFTTEQITTMEDLFSGCAALRSLNLSSFNTAQVTNMKNMFNGCATLTSLDLRSFNTAQVTNMQNMFSDCSRLTTLYLNSFNTAQVTNMQNMFNGCGAMTNLYLDNFNMSNVSNANKLDMFKDMANNKIPQSPCTVYCPESVQQAVLAHDDNGYYSGLDDQNPTGNYYNTPYWDSNIGAMTTGRRIVFARPTTSK